ncbi:MAG: hypothetical protein CHKLHMKO_00537 [Candidatus Argoarchaeum ethanivorans]|uniref:Uncharacterized protein n=1 Tax=Candidatus Argoarchaeum ethanivorans TaxID=2608793 RepID=A0A811TG83_9EURY|nr:MAG: hypothetical protein CHKLHMKO_00531 [Candidatus Argoarchaeum ethanivorans]CAD6493778.1 MAG: hypothetical protein CHKLHMKO_00537 [Candidatus Argoarchaeum ethanivorans]
MGGLLRTGRMWKGVQSLGKSMRILVMQESDWAEMGAHREFMLMNIV